MTSSCSRSSNDLFIFYCFRRTTVSVCVCVCGVLITRDDLATERKDKASEERLGDFEHHTVQGRTSTTRLASKPLSKLLCSTGELNQNCDSVSRNQRLWNFRIVYSLIVAFRLFYFNRCVCAITFLVYFNGCPCYITVLFLIIFS